MLGRAKSVKDGATDYTDARVDHRAQLEQEFNQPHAIRRWDATYTDRLNEAHWAGVNGSGGYYMHVNADLESHIENLTARCIHEFMTNPEVEGMVKSYGKDLFGKTGPTLNINSTDEEFNIAAKKVWRKWWKNPTVSNDICGRELLSRWNISLWTKGSILAQVVPDSQTESAVKLKLLDLDPRRLQTPPKLVGDQATVLGTTFTKMGAPRTKWVRDIRNVVTPHLSMDFRYEDIPADQMIHAYESIEAGQATGIPWLASMLQDFADLRDFDKQVLDAARAAADSAVLLQTKQPELISDARPLSMSETFTFQRRQIKAIPAGYEANQMKAEQPTNNYVEFRHERLRSIGRARHIPLLIMLLSAENSNFSQSRMDVNVIYERGLDEIRSWWENAVLTKLARIVLNDARMDLPPFPEDFEVTWGWTPMKQADEAKSEKAKEARLRRGIDTYEEQLAEEGKDLETQVAARQRINELLESSGLEPIPSFDSPVEAVEEPEESTLAKEKKSDKPETAKRSTEELIEAAIRDVLDGVESNA